MATTDEQRSPGSLIDADDTALIMIDFQPKLMLACTTLAPEKLISNALGLAEVGATFELPILSTGGRPGDPLLQSVLDAAGPTRKQVDRKSLGIFGTPAFAEAVRATGRNTLVMAGITTDLCVMLSALAAREAGYAVQVVVDASASFTRQIEEAALMRLVQAGVALTTWGAFAAELHRASGWQEGVGPKLMDSFRRHHGPEGLIGAMPD